MINLENKLKVIRELLENEDSRQIRYAALECRLALEEICYDRLSLAHKYIPIEKVRAWQPPQLLKFLFNEVEPSLLGGSKLSISKTPTDSLRELSRKDYEAIEWVEVGEQSTLDVGKISKLNYKISGHLHSKMPSEKGHNVSVDSEKLKRHINEVVDELERLSNGKIDFFWPQDTRSFECLCGEDIVRTKHSLENAKVITCLSSSCRITYAPQLTTKGYELLRRVATINCPHCGCSIPQEFTDLEKLSIGSEWATECSSCKGKLKLTPAFNVLKAEA